MEFTCDDCGIKRNTEEEIKNHQCQTKAENVTPTRNDDNLCSKCCKRFSSKSNRIHHEKRCHLIKPRQRGNVEKNITDCKKCRKQFSSYTGRLKHEKKCNGVHANSAFECPVCQEKFNSSRELVEHQTRRSHVTAGGSGSSSKRRSEDDHSSMNEKKWKQFTSCHKCDFSCSTHTELYDHRATSHFQSDEIISTLPPLPWSPSDILPWIHNDGSVNMGLKKTYNQHKHLILKRKRTDLTNVSNYNFPVSNDLNMEELMEQVEEIYEDNNNAFKLNISLGFILVNIETGEYRYFAGYSNQNLFDLPVLISNRNGIQVLRRRLNEMDILNYILKQRPDTKFKPVMITNIIYTIYKAAFPLGAGAVLPNFILKHKSIIALSRKPNTGKLYDDDLCLFRCIAYHQIKSCKLETLSKQLYDKWFHYAKTNKLRSSDICLQTISDVEQCFKVNINVYSLKKDKCVEVNYKSRNTFYENERLNTVNLNLYENHLSYITNFSRYASKFECKMCQKLFPTSFRLNRHQRVCEKATKLRFPGGILPTKKNNI